MLLVGCSKDYERDTTKGEEIQITLAEFEEKMANGDSFAVMLTQSHCQYCKEFESYLIPYMEEHHLVMYNVVLDYEETSAQENLQIIHQYFSDFNNTPGIYYVKDGKKKSHLAPKNNEINGDMLEEWVKLNKIDEKQD